MRQTALKNHALFPKMFCLASGSKLWSPPWTETSETAKINPSYLKLFPSCILHSDEKLL
jgi:hypothetical protein